MEKDLGKIFDELPTSCVITDSSGKVIYANSAVTGKTQFEVPEIVDKKPGELWGGAMNNGFYEAFWQEIRENKPFRAPIINRQKSGFEYRDVLQVIPAGKYYFAVGQERVDSEFDFYRAVQDSRGPAQNFFGALGYYLGGSYGENMVALELLKGKPESVEEIIAIIENKTKNKFKERHEDADLIREAQNSPKAFHLLFTKYYKDIVSYFRHHLVGEYKQCEDLTQETFLRAYKNIQAFTITNASYRTYLRRVAHNVLVNHLRDNVEKIHIALEDVSPNDHPTTVYNYREKVSLEGASTAEKRILEMKYLEGYSIREIAIELGKSENAVKLILSRTRKKLRSK